MDFSFTEFAEAAATALQFVGLLIIVGATIAVFRYVHRLITRGTRSFEGFRADLGKAIVLGLEVLVAADIIETLVVERTLQAVGVLGLLVLIRVVLSWSLSVEIEGFLPWRRWQVEQAASADRGA